MNKQQVHEHNKQLMTLLYSRKLEQVEQLISTMDPVRDQVLITNLVYNIATKKTTRSRRVIQLLENYGLVQ